MAKQIQRINQLIKEIMRAPVSGIGKLAPLRHAVQGYWSRRIDREHRIVDKVGGAQVWIAQLLYHYFD